jgi:hypothetical protein
LTTTKELTMTATKIQKFETIIDLEFDVQSAEASVAFMPSNTSDRIACATRRHAKEAKARLFAAIGGLTPAEMVAFGPYRVAVRAEILSQA